MNLLHVADDRDEREALSNSLSALGHTVTSVCAGLEACRYVRRRQSVDAILLSLGRSPARPELFRRWVLRNRKGFIPMVLLAPSQELAGWRAVFERCLLVRLPVQLGELQYALSQFQPRLNAPLAAHP